MIATKGFQPLMSQLSGPEDLTQDSILNQQLSSSEREMSAFVAAVTQMFGAVAAALAAEYWIAFVESMDVPLVDACPDWRRVTIAAASRLAAEGCISNHERITNTEEIDLA